MTTDGARIAHTTFAVLGTVLLVVGCGGTVVFGVLAAFLNDVCSGPNFEPGQALDCGNAEPVRWLLFITPLVVGPGAALLTWLRSTRDGRYRPRGWAPFVGLGVLAVAWILAVELYPVF
jgi:hypothetical protein